MFTWFNGFFIVHIIDLLLGLLLIIIRAKEIVFISTSEFKIC